MIFITNESHKIFVVGKDEWDKKEDTGKSMNSIAVWQKATVRLLPALPCPACLPACLRDVFRLA